MKTFFFFGDSLTLGVNDKSMLGWTGRFASTLGLPVPPTTFYNLGARKHTSQAVISRWKEEVQRRALPESEVRIMFCFGVVDMAAPQGETIIPLRQSIVNLETLLEDVTAIHRAGNVRVLSPFPVAQVEHCNRVDELSSAYAAVSRKFGVEYIDIFSHLVSSNAYMSDLSDGVHPGGSGCELIADYLRKDTSIAEWVL